jgi:hypothetical protein
MANNHQPNSLNNPHHPIQQADYIQNPSSIGSSNQQPNDLYQAKKPDWLDGYGQLVDERHRDGWSCYLVTIMFTQLPGAREVVLDRMKDEIQRVYSTLVTDVHRKPRTAPSDQLPVLIGAFDLPVYKRDRSTAPLVRCNDGLHFHALVLIPPTSRLKGSLVDYFHDKERIFIRRDKPIQRIQVEPVTHDPARVTDYALKTISKRRLSYDDSLLVLPRVRSEL